MLSQSATWSGLRGLQATVQGGYFHTDDYASRIYTYERGLLYAFSFPAYFGEGLHYALFLRADMGQRWMLIAKLSVTDYFDRDHISSGLQQIDRSSKADLWNFSYDSNCEPVPPLLCVNCIYAIVSIRLCPQNKERAIFINTHTNWCDF